MLKLTASPQCRYVFVFLFFQLVVVWLVPWRFFFLCGWCCFPFIIFFFLNCFVFFPRTEFDRLVEQHEVDPHADEGEGEVDLAVNNPLSQAEDSKWGAFFERSELEKVIQQDIGSACAREIPTFGCIMIILALRPVCFYYLLFPLWVSFIAPPPEA
jgi:hypothetical protein